MAISRRALAEFLERELDSFTWMKDLPRERVIDELRSMKLRPVFKTDPWLHQMVCFLIAMSMPQFLFLLDMGLGKTKIIADIITHRLRGGLLDRALITVPRLVNIDSWKDDLERHSDLGYELISCEDIEEKRHRLLHPAKDADVTVIDYASLHLALCDKVKGAKGRGKLVKNDAAMQRVRALYNFIGIDESHKLTNMENLWFSIMREVCEGADYVYATTGTLFGNRVQDAWPQFFLVDGGETLGENLSIFTEAFFEMKTTAWKVEPRFIKRMDRDLHRMLQHRSIRYSEEEVPEIDLPSMPPPIVRRLDMTEEQREHYTNALEGLINAGGVLAALDGAWTRMRQICSGYLAWKDENGNHIVRFRRNPKLDDLEGLLEQMLDDSKVVVVYWFTETGRLISERLKELKVEHEWFWGGSKDHSAQRRRFLDDPACRVFLMQASAGGEGTDGLQKVSRYGVMFETPSSPTLRKQTMKRIQRAGQKRRVRWYDLTMRRSLEGGMLADIQDGIDLYERVVNGRRPDRGFFLHD